MLQTIGAASLTPHHFFYDYLNSQLILLREGTLFTQHLNTTHQTPTNIRHSPLAPTPARPALVPLLGEVVADVARRVVAASSEEAGVRGSVEIVDGSGWEWYAPISLQRIKLGICKIEDNQEITYELFQFNSSTPRTVAFRVQGDQLQVTVNGHPLAKNSSKIIAYDSGKNRWFPCAKIEEKGNTLVFRPFSDSAVSLQGQHELTFGDKGKGEAPLLISSGPVEFKEVKIRRLEQLSKDSFLLVWENEAARLVERNKRTGRFDLLALAVQDEYVFDLFTNEEYSQLAGWRGDSPLLPYSEVMTLSHAYDWLKYLLQATNFTQQEYRSDIYFILLTKLAILRPHFLKCNLPVPDLTPLLSRFSEDPSALPSVVRSNTQWRVEGVVLDMSEHYLVSKVDNTIILYNIHNSITQVFREVVDQKLLFSKRTATQNYDEEDIRNLKNQGSFLYKILSGCLQKGKRPEELHAVNDNDVRELVRDYGIDERAAREALEYTGHVEQALVWIFTDKKSGKGKKGEPSKDVAVERVEGVHILQLDNMFARLLLQVGSRIFVLGMLPSELKNWCYKGEKDYVDLLTLKHEEDIASLDWRSWYSGSKHPRLHILDEIEVPEVPDLLFRQGQELYYLGQEEGIYHKKRIDFNADLLYESQESLTIAESTPLEYFAAKEGLAKTIKGQLIIEENIKSSEFGVDTVWTLNGSLFSNITHDLVRVAEVSLDAQENLLPSISGQQKLLPFIVESGPPGCSSNYSITSMLKPKSSFLANYPSKVMLRHLHSKLIRLTSFTLHRSSHRKNVNYIQEGEIYLLDEFGNESKRVTFAFEAGQNEKDIAVDESGYWRFVVLAPKFTEIKKLPYEYGFVSIKGFDVSAEVYESSYHRELQKHLAERIGKAVIVVGVDRKPLEPLRVQIAVQGELEQTLKEELKQSLKYTEDSVTSASKVTESKDINFLSASQILKLLYPTSSSLENTLRSISRSSTFSLSKFTKGEVFKFIDLVIYCTGSLLPFQEYFESMFGKIWQNQFGKEYLLQMAASLDQAPTIPYPYIKLLIAQLDSQQHKSTIKAILTALHKVRSPRYQSLDRKYSQLLFETEFYSSHYLNLIEGVPAKTEQTFREPLIQTEFVAIKGENSRRIVVKLPSLHYISDFSLRVERCEQASRAKYRVFVLEKNGKRRIGSGEIHDHQWSQIAKEIYKQGHDDIDGVKSLNIYGLNIPPTTAQYLQIQLLFTETGILNHESESSKIPQIDILPELYGYSTGSDAKLDSVESLFSFNPEEMFFLSVSSLGLRPLQKFSASRGKQGEYLYFKTQSDDQALFKNKIQEKSEKGDYDALANLQRKLVSSTRQFSSKVCLDYLYTVLILCLNELERAEVRLDDDICKDLFEQIVRASQGPVKISAFKALSKNIPLLVKSLQFVEEELPTLGRLAFSYEELLDVIDLGNAQLCQSLTRLVLRVVSYESRWAELLIKMSPKTQAHEEISKYFIVSDEWLSNNTILEYVANLPDQLFQSSFLNLVSYQQLCKLVTKKSAKPRLELLLEVIVEKASETNQVDLDVVGLIFQQEQVRWDQLQKVVVCCSQAVDTVIHQFLQSQTPEVLALQYSALLTTATNAKYSQEFATFLNLIYNRDKSAFKEVLLSISGKCASLHYDCLDTIGSFIFSTCNFGGIEGVRLLGENDLTSLQVAVEALKILEKVPQGAEMPSEEGFIEWYLGNNDYQQANRNPANKSPGYHLMRQLIELVFALLKSTSSSRILAKYALLVQRLRGSRRINLFQKHLTFNQLHHGATQLLAHTLAPGSLAEVLVGSQNPALSTVINELKSSLMKEGSRKMKWNNTKEIDISDKFELVPQAKELQGGKIGTKSPAFKIPISQKAIRLESSTAEWPSKFIIGFCLNDHAENKNAILPAKAQLYGGNGTSFFKVGELKVIEDQYYLSFGVKLYSIDFSSTAALGLSGVKALQLRLAEPLLCSASEILENGQRSKKGATYNISFVNVSGYDSLPTEEPDYSQLYVTLLGFLGQPKYHADLKKVVASELFDQKLQLIIQVLNDLLPNELIENLLITLNKEGQNILEHILRSKGANSRLVSRLILGKLTKDNIGKLLAYTLTNLTPEYVSIVTMSIRLASYSIPDRESAKLLSDFSNIERLVEKYESGQGVSKGLYYQILVSLLTVPNLYHYQIGKLIKLVWNSARKAELYTLLAAILPYYHKEIETFSSNGYTAIVLEELLTVLRDNKTVGEILKNPHSHIMLLNSLLSSNSSRQILLEKKAPIAIVELLKSEKTLLQKYSPEVMKLFITFFQGTCIATSCQDEFSEILINLMTSLNNFDSVHHQYFIQNFFFPLINAFQGVPLFFVWKEKEQYIWQPTDALKKNPIRSNANVINHKGKFYAPVELITQSLLKSNLVVLLKENNQVCFTIADNEAIDTQSNKKITHSFNEGKIVLNLSAEESITIPNEKYTISEESQWENQLLTNATLINLQNPWILQEKYRSVLPIRESTTERCYFLPLEITLGEVLKTFNISGFRVHSADLANIKVKNYLTNSEVAHNLTLREILQTQKLSYLKLELQASLLFQSTTIESLVEDQVRPAAFVPQQTIFKAFEQKKGLEKLIGVLTGCVKNWTNSEQSKIWEQYLKELQSYSCFPVFSSLYMTRQSNVSLLFDLLFGLPDKQDSKKWSLKEKESVKELYGIIKDVFAVEGQQAITVRSYALKSGFYSTMLNRLHLITKEPKREKVEEIKEEEEQIVPNLEKKESEEEFKNKLQKRKGVGYGNDSSTNQKWDVTGQQQARKEQSEQILGLLKILEKFLDSKDFDYPQEILQQTFESSLLPIIQNSLRGGSLLEISKYAELIQGELSFIQVIAKSKKLIPTLMPLPKNYEPRQPESLHSLLKTLANTSKIFLSCLTGSASEKVSQEIAKKIASTFDLVDEAVSEYETTHHNDEDEDRKILELPLGKKYPILLKDLRFDYIDMKDTNGKITKHHYASYYQAGHKSPVEKTVRLAQELADVSHALPIDHTNAIFVRCDKERVDYMQALIMGSNGTPYGHGAYLFDIYFEDNYPNGPPKVNLTTTGNGQIRFNPNLYSCGKVCLSLLGTWRGSAMENWDAKVSTLLQVLVSIQSIIMSEDIYFNEPGFQHEQGTLEGEKKNEAYANIVRYGNVKFAMTDNIKNPPKGFETIIRRHFYLKKAEILEECQRWLKLAEKREASYNGLVSDHNYNWCNTFKKSKTEYKTMLEKAVKELEVELNKLPIPTSEDLKKEQSPLKKKKKEVVAVSPTKLDAVMQEIDVSYGGAQENIELDINDEKVKDRWSRYIGAMGVQAVSKQSKASILLLGLGPLGIEIAKNIVLSGCKQLALCDNKEVQWSDLSGQFFLEEKDVGKSRLQSSIYKLQELNHYVKVSKFEYDINNLTKFQVVIATEKDFEQQQKIDEFCRNNKIHFVSADCYGPFGQLFNDFGEEFEILDKNGEEPIEVILEEITNAEQGLVRVSKGLRHPFEDGESVRLLGVKGMKSLSNEAESINGTIHKVKVIDQFSFFIGDTSGYTAYEGDGTAKNIKTPLKLKFRSLKEASEEQIIDSNLEYYDFTKGPYLRLLHHAFRALGRFQAKNSRLPSHSSREDALQLIEQVKKTKSELSEDDIKYLKLFSITCSGNFGPICALYGGIASQEVFKAITGKYTPINQYFLSDFSQVVDGLPEDEEAWQRFIEDRKSGENRREGIKRVIGNDLLSKLQNSKVFMVGSGAIGCQLLKNFAMLEIGAGEAKGNIVVTDPDHIETSNLNRQFLFREKHLRKPKSATAAAAVIQMNPRLKGHIKARLDKVCEGTKDIFSNEFFEGLSIVANALDNVEARRYVDSRCVENKVALLESGTLSSKGHVQVIIPYKTETYGSKQDPNDANGQVPHCTLKMFPEETLHCVEWARDLFGKEFTLSPKALSKLLESQATFTPGPSDIQMLKDCLKMLQSRPNNFQEAASVAAKVFYQLFRNDILQLLYTYPLDSKTKDGKPFWRLPKRPPTAIERIDPNDPLHATFISSYAVLLSKVHSIPFPKDFRDPLKRKEIAEIALTFKVEPFTPSDKVAKEMTEEVNNENQKQEDSSAKEEVAQQGQNELFERFKAVLADLREGGDVLTSKAEQFQKDEDQNGHIDLIYSMANLRSRNYKLDEMDWINVKLKAGRIMPALSTTTSCIAALQTIELVKYIKGCKVDAMRNAFINLAVPILQLGEPGEAEKIKVHENLSTNLWERWSVPSKRTESLRALIASIQQKYGVSVKGLDLVDGGQVFSDIVLSLQSKKEEKEKLLNKTLSQLLSEQLQQESTRFIDLTLLMSVNEQLIKHAPTLRVSLE